eukprot:TRINITY_DN22177_c0_g1_i2.p1 TRINITY_DN22177_c0_g1~~TRINITY_DN22177_c0_g1_i2.p1  ORF type:complete len:254 (+),score=64.66 TRINITY_DN22177_c0_g1_i2:54-815(+)
MPLRPCRSSTTTPPTRALSMGGGVTKWGSWSPSPLKFHPTEEPSGNTHLRVSTDLTTGFYSTQDVAQIVESISMSKAVPTSMNGFGQYAIDVLGSATLLAAFNMNLLASSKRFQRDLGDLVCGALDHTSTTTSSSAPLSIEKEAVQTEKVVKLLGVFVTAPTTTTTATTTPSLYWDHAAWSTTLTTHISTVILGLSLIHISEPTRLLSISYAVFCLKKKKKKTKKKKNKKTKNKQKIKKTKKKYIKIKKKIKK